MAICYIMLYFLISCIIGVPVQVGSVAVRPIVPGNNFVGLRVSWNRVSGNNIMFEVQNKTAASNGWSTAVSSTTTGLTQNLNGLDPDTKYDVRVRAVSNDGNGTWSRTVQARAFQC